MIIEETLIAYLSTALHDSGYPVYAMTPKQDVPRNYIVIDKTGSTHFNGIDRATIALQSISSDSLMKAVEINEDAKKLMIGDPSDPDPEKKVGFRSITDVFGVHLQTDYNFTNTATKQFRYQAVYEINYKR